MNDFINTYQTQLLLVAGFLVNTLASFVSLRNGSPDGFWAKLMHLVLQGFTKVDPVKTPTPPTTLFVLLLALPLLNGCSWLKQEKLWDAAQNLCVVALTAQPEVKAAAAARSISVGDWSEYICHFDDVYELFVKQTGLKVASPTTEALARARAHGAL